jgi:hypothetical protein
VLEVVLVVVDEQGQELAVGEVAEGVWWGQGGGRGGEVVGADEAVDGVAGVWVVGGEEGEVWVEFLEEGGDWLREV